MGVVEEFLRVQKDKLQHALAKTCARQKVKIEDLFQNNHIPGMFCFCLQFVECAYVFYFMVEWSPLFDILLYRLSLLDFEPTIPHGSIL